VDQPPAAGASQIRTANQKRYAQVKSLIEKVRQTTERVAVRANKPDELRGKTEPLRKEVSDAYRTLHQIAPIGDDLLLLGEREGEQIKKEAEALKAPLDAAVATLRPHLGSEVGLANAVSRRAKEQLGNLKQADDLIKQQKWATAHDKLRDLLNSADEVGRFVDPKEAEPLYNPIIERTVQVWPHILEEQKGRLLPALREEYAAVRPDLAALKNKLADVSRGMKEKKEIRWNDRLLPGPACLLEVAEAWRQTDRSVVQAAAVLHAIGGPAGTDQKVLQAEYEAARIQAVLLVRELVMGETATLTAGEVEGRYFGYLDAIAQFMSAVHESPDRFLPVATHLAELAARSKTLPNGIARYRAATDESLRWRRRLTQRQLRRAHQDKPPAELLAKLLTTPPARPGQQGPGGLKRVNQMSWSAQQAPEILATAWTQDWRDIAVFAQGPRAQWKTGSDPVFVSPWQGTARAEVAFPRTTLVDLGDSLAKDLLSTPARPPLTLDAALALHSATHGPYVEFGGAITTVSVANLTDRLWDQPDPSDVLGSLAAGTLISYPSYPAVVQLQVKPSWVAHDLFVWTSAPPPPPVSPPPPPAKPTPVVAETPRATSEPPATGTAPKSAAAATTAPANAKAPGTAPPTTGGVAGMPAGSPGAAKKSEPTKPKGPIPKGGVAF
jgi:hypothetical protein